MNPIYPPSYPPTKIPAHVNESLQEPSSAVLHNHPHVWPHDFSTATLLSAHRSVGFFASVGPWWRCSWIPGAGARIWPEEEGKARTEKICISLKESKHLMDRNIMECLPSSWGGWRDQCGSMCSMECPPTNLEGTQTGQMALAYLPPHQPALRMVHRSPKRAKLPNQPILSCWSM